MDRTKNLRIVFNNAADRALLSASSQASTALGVANLLTDTKIECLRSVGTAQTITATWEGPEAFGALVFPFTNLTSLATMRVRGYSTIVDPTPIFDTGYVECCAGPELGDWDWTNLPLGQNSYGSLAGWSAGAALSANAFAYGGGSCAVVWLATQQVVRKIIVDIADPTNLAGYIELARMVCGSYWSPEENADYGVNVSSVDRSESYRNGGGDLITNIGTKHKKISFTLSAMSPADRAVLWHIVRRNGTMAPVFFSLSPVSDDVLLEQAQQLYGKFVNSPAISSARYQTYASTIELEEI